MSDSCSTPASVNASARASGSFHPGLNRRQPCHAISVNPRAFVLPVKKHTFDAPGWLCEKQSVIILPLFTQTSAKLFHLGPSARRISSAVFDDSFGIVSRSGEFFGFARFWIYELPSLLFLNVLPVSRLPFCDFELRGLCPIRTRISNGRDRPHLWRIRGALRNTKRVRA